jgi:DHA1 family bicyclomycin/chloramphenicol resistance-like MFS transporter
VRVASPGQRPARRPFAPGTAGFVVLIAAMMTMTAMTIDINLPAIPATAADLGAPLTAAQLSVPVFFGGFALGQALWGPLSDRTGRRPALLTGIVIYLASTAACALAGSIETLLAMRVVEGFGAGAGSVLGRAVIRDRFAGADMARIMSLALAAFVTAPIIAPSIGALILGFAGWRAIFWFLLAYGVVLLVLAALFLEESLATRRADALRPARLLAGYRAVFGSARSRWPALVVVMAFTTLTIYLTNASVVFMTSYGMSASAFGLTFAVIAVASALGNLANARLVRRLELWRIIRIGILGQLAGALLALLVELAGAASGWWLVGPLAVHFFFFGLVVANATTLALLPHGTIVGGATSALGVAQTVLPALIASGVALLHAGTARPTLVALVLAVLGAALAHRLARRGQP